MRSTGSTTTDNWLKRPTLRIS